MDHFTNVVASVWHLYFEREGGFRLSDPRLTAVRQLVDVFLSGPGAALLVEMQADIYRQSVVKFMFDSLAACLPNGELGTGLKWVSPPPRGWLARVRPHRCPHVAAYSTAGSALTSS